MSHKTAATVAHTIGIDTGKNTLHLIGLDDQGAIVLPGTRLPAAGLAELRTPSRPAGIGRIRYTYMVQTDENRQSILEQWVLHGAGHAWSGGSTARSYTELRGPDASCEMMRFFLQCPPAVASRLVRRFPHFASQSSSRCRLSMATETPEQALKAPQRPVRLDHFPLPRTHLDG